MIFKSRSMSGDELIPTNRPAGLETLEPRLLLSGTLSAEFVSVDNTSVLTGVETAYLQVTATTDWTAAALLIELTQGSNYQDANGSNKPPNPGFFVLFPTL